jgi:hypothetical protein
VISTLHNFPGQCTRWCSMNLARLRIQRECAGKGRSDAVFAGGYAAILSHSGLIDTRSSNSRGPLLCGGVENSDAAFATSRQQRAFRSRMQDLLGCQPFLGFVTDRSRKTDRRDPSRGSGAEPERNQGHAMDSGRRRAGAHATAEHGGRNAFASTRTPGVPEPAGGRHPYEYGAGSSAGKQGSPNYAGAAKGSPEGQPTPVNIAAPPHQGSVSPSSPAKSPGLDEHARAKVTLAQNVASAVEGGLRKQRDHLQAQLDKAARREAELEFRIGELEEKLLLEDSVWSELAMDPSMAPEAMALQLRRAKEMQMWASRAEEDERRARIAAEEALKQLEKERDAAQQQLACAQAMLAQVRDPKSALNEAHQRRVQHGPDGAGAGNDVSPLVSRDALPAAGRDNGRQRLEAAMHEAYRRAGVVANTHGGKEPRQRSLEPSPHYAPTAADASPYTPRAIETPSSFAPSSHTLQPQHARASPSFEIDEAGRLLVAPSVSPSASGADTSAADYKGLRSSSKVCVTHTQTNTHKHTYTHTLCSARDI